MIMGVACIGPLELGLAFEIVRKAVRLGQPYRAEIGYIGGVVGSFRQNKERTWQKTKHHT